MTSSLRQLESGEVLFQEGESFDGLYFIKEGKLEIYRRRENMDINLGYSGPGDVLGTVTLFSRENRTASARAVTQTVVQHLNSQTLDQVMKQVPTWVVALLKDTIARLKHVDEKFVDCSIREKKLQQRLGTTLHHAMQFCHLIASLIHLKVIEEEGVILFPLKGLSARAEAILLQRGEYFEKMMELIGKCGVCKLGNDKKHGPCIIMPKAAAFEDFAQFCAQVIKTGQGHFMPKKLQPLVSGLLRMHRRINPPVIIFEESVLKEEWGKELGREITGALIQETIQHKILTVPTSGAGGTLTYAPQALQKRLIFESTIQSLKDMDPEAS